MINTHWLIRWNCQKWVRQFFAPSLRFGRESTCLDPPSSVALFGRNSTPQRAELSSPDARYPVQVITVVFPLLNPLESSELGAGDLRAFRSSGRASTRCGPSSSTARSGQISTPQRVTIRRSGAWITRWGLYSLFSAATMLYSLVNTIKTIQCGWRAMFISIAGDDTMRMRAYRYDYVWESFYIWWALCLQCTI